ncbi:hypothetical protein [Mesorhizobium sp.]|uniref:hypothetical protein n=1 Tax=Mesorhizobium sp. TaxID=1871066 RepID=UPI0025C41B54|nr:hypothetical protein [Mesorhizobium sp.]
MTPSNKLLARLPRAELEPVAPDLDPVPLPLKTVLHEAIQPIEYVYFVERLHKFLLRYLMALLNQIAQNTSCNRLHEVQERCARWLLQTHDRVDSDEFPLTQEFFPRCSVCIARA